MFLVAQEKCGCLCHTLAGGMTHKINCCKTCPYCQKNIKPEFYRKHTKRCKKEHTNN